MRDHANRNSVTSLCWAMILGLALFVNETTAADDELKVGRADEWHFNVAPYLWLAGMDGDLTVRGFEANLDVSFGDLFDVLDIGLIGHFEASKGPWAIMSDLVYLKVSEDGDTPGPVISSVDAEMKTLILELGGAYEFYTNEDSEAKRPISLSALGGIRYTHLDADLDITPIASPSGSQNWVDPFLGMRGTIQLTRRWSFGLRFDIGGFGVGSDFVYQFITHQKIELNKRLDLLLGYRWLDYDYEDGSGANKFEFDVTMSGPFLGLNIKF